MALLPRSAVDVPPEGHGGQGGVKYTVKHKTS